MRKNSRKEEKKMNPKTILISLLFFTSLIVMVSAAPYQLNLSTGTLIDLNETANFTTNLTIYIIHQNVSYPISYNYTNCNVSFYNYTNYTFVLNDTNGTIYTVNETNNKFLTISAFDSYKFSLSYPYAPLSELNNLVTKVNELNQTVADNKENSGTVIIWGVIIIDTILVIVAIFLIFKFGSQQ